MSKDKKGIRIGHYRITPLGIGTFLALIVIIAVSAVLLSKPSDDAQKTVAVNSVKAQSTLPAATQESVAEDTPAPAATDEGEIEVTQAPEITEAPTAIPSRRSATIRALGEIAMETELLKSAYLPESNSFDFAPMFSEIASVMGNADYTIADVEGSLGGTAGISGEGKMLTPSSLLTVLKDCGVDMLMLSNEHVLNGGLDDMKAACANVQSAGLDSVGAYTSPEDRNTPRVIDISGIKVGFISYTESVLNTKIDKSAAAYCVSGVFNSNPANDIAGAREAGAEVIVVLMNWGSVLNRNVSQTDMGLAQLFCQAGVDVIIGYNPHVIQPMQWIEAEAMDGSGTNRTLCLYATGNFLSNQTAQYADSGVVFEFTIQENDEGALEIVSPVYIPTYVWIQKKPDNEQLFDYRTVAVGQWVGTEEEKMPTGMDYTDYQRMSAVWAEAQSIVCAVQPDIATIGRE